MTVNDITVTHNKLKIYIKTLVEFYVADFGNSFIFFLVCLFVDCTLSTDVGWRNGTGIGAVYWSVFSLWLRPMYIIIQKVM